MRKLTVKNFSVIKEAELEFGKITVLIGPQASGKSLLCKLAYFLGKKTIDIALTAILRKDAFEEFRADFTREFLNWFPIEIWVGADTFVQFGSSNFGVNISGSDVTDAFRMKAEFSTQFESVFSHLTDQIGEIPDTGADSRKYLFEQAEAQLNLLMTKDFVFRSVYIPDGRAFFVNQSLGFIALNNADIDPLVRDFSFEVRLGESWNPNPVAGEKARRVIDEIRQEILHIVGGHIEGRNTSAKFRQASDGRSIPLTLLSSGTQELLPLLNVLGQIATGQRDKIIFPRPNNLPGMPSQIILSKGLIYLEEPEANVFPNTQYQLVRLFARLSQEPTLDFSWVITTHSPYILTAFNTLIEAWRAGNKEGKRAKVANIIPEKYWVNESDFAAYSIHNGVLVPIFEKEQEGVEGSGLIDGDYLDSVSDQLGGEFEKLLDIEYAN
jgi:energy-coupling factor transporter ATP-binding protein EcfA2